ncbi:protein of unknown function (plasmid) [Paraburkholderia dioscoreae]|uniref:Uncharacterized protein n=1 Tax=Paraburkholderia dioscoreae TaxID=2604047 RepID=A0A5Q4ZEI9_9BURK|nr:protein of unknown function [Paraburkholderia dioscoreae]
MFLAAACRFATRRLAACGRAELAVTRRRAAAHDIRLRLQCPHSACLRSTVELFADGCGNTSAQPMLTNTCPFF